MDEGTLSDKKQPTSAATPAGVATPRPVQPAQPAQPQRDEVEPTVPYAIVPGPGRDTFLFYHMNASSKDVNGLWEYCRFCVSHIFWVNDHFVVTPNPCYLIQAADLDERFAKIKRVLLNWYGAKRLVSDVEISLG